MKKIVLSFLLILVLALPVFAEGGTAQVQINAKVPSGTGTGDVGDITVGGVNIKIAYQEDGTVPSGTTWPNNPDMVTGETKPEITADLVQGDDEAGCDALYLLVGVTGNPETETQVTVSFDAPGWYSGSEGKTEGSQPVSNLELHCATTVTATSGNGTKVSASNDGAPTGTDSNNKPIVITHAVGVQKTPVLAGYAKLTWGITNGAVVNAGDYSTTITVKIDGDGASGVEETT